jgi:hypothetical protein
MRRVARRNAGLAIFVIPAKAGIQLENQAVREGAPFSFVVPAQYLTGELGGGLLQPALVSSHEVT